MKINELLDEKEVKLYNFTGEEDVLLYLFKIIDKPTDEKRAIAIDNFFGDMVISLAKTQFKEKLKEINKLYLQKNNELNIQVLFSLPQKILDATQDRYLLEMGNQVKVTFDKLTKFATENNLPWTFDDDYILNISANTIPSAYPLELSEYDSLVTQFVTSAKPENFLAKYIDGNVIEELNNRANRHQIILNCHLLTKQALTFNSSLISTQAKNQIILKSYQLATTYQQNIKWHTKLFHGNTIRKEKELIDELARTIVAISK